MDADVFHFEPDLTSADYYALKDFHMRNQAYKDRVRRIAGFFVQALRLEENLDAVRGFAMMFGDFHVGQAGAHFAANNFVTVLWDKNELTTLYRLMFSHIKPLEIPQQPLGRRSAPNTLTHTTEYQRWVSQRPISADALKTEAVTLRNALRRSLPIRLIFFCGSSQWWITRNEAGIAEYTAAVVIPAALKVLRLLLKASGTHQGKNVHIQSEHHKSGSGRKGGTRVDQFIILQRGPQPARDGVKLGFIEYKTPGTLDSDDWEKNAKNGQPQVVMNMESQSLMLWFPQVLHYACEHDTRDTMAMDGLECIPVNWEIPPNNRPPRDQIVKLWGTKQNEALIARTYALTRNTKRHGSRTLVYDSDDAAITTQVAILRMALGGLKVNGIHLV